MRCPNCKKKMEKGVLKSGKDIIWSSKALIDKAEDVLVADKKTFGSKVESYYCENCGYIVIPAPRKEG